jgi:hypothetical protein
MNYATWKLNFTNPEYGTGPEDKISELGYHAESAWADGQVENGATIMGYLTQPQDETKLTTWEFKNISQLEALEFCLAITPQAYLLPDGRITAPIEDIS